MEVGKRNPLEIDFSVMKCNGADAPELEIIGHGPRSSSRSQDDPSFEHGRDDEFAELSNHDLQARIGTYQRHLKSFKLSDGGLKIKRILERLEKENERRHSHSTEDTQPSSKLKGDNSKLINGGAGRPQQTSALMGNHNDGLACSTSQRKTGQQGFFSGSSKTPGAFSMELGFMKGKLQNAFPESRAIQRSGPGSQKIDDQAHASQGHPTNHIFSGSKTCAPSKFYSCSENSWLRKGPSQDLERFLDDDKYSNTGRKSLKSRVVASDKSDENKLLFADSKITEDGSPEDFFLPASSKRQDPQYTVKKPVSGQTHGETTNGRSLPGKRKHMDIIGTSLDMAMELSDDEEKGAMEYAHFDSQSCSTWGQGLRCFPRWKEGPSIAYPSGDPEAVEVHHSDLMRLAPLEFLNDTIIDFYIKYIQRVENLSDEKRERLHFFNSFFFKKLLLEKKKMNGNECFSKLRKWTRGVNIFEKTYLLVPVCDSAHWSLAIICFAKEKGNVQVLLPYVLHLDSMRAGHVSEDIFRLLNSFLKAEWDHIRGISNAAESVRGDLRRGVLKRVEVPLQENDSDCGLFLLFFIECFVRDAPLEFEPSLLSQMFGRHWFKSAEASHLRVFIKTLLESLFQEAKRENVLEIVMEDMD